MSAALDMAAELRCALDPVAFARERLGFEPDTWQAGVLRSTGRNILLNCSRQSGKSTTTAIIGLHTAFYQPRALVLLVSPSLRQSRELFAKVSDFRRVLEPRPRLDEDNRLSFTLDNGSRVVSLPGTSETVRGFSAPRLVVEDEAAFVDDGLYGALRPMLAVSGGRLILMSTPFGRGVCCAGQGAPSAHEMTNGRVFHQQISPIKGQIVIYPASLGPGYCWATLCVTIVSNGEEPSGESRIRYSRSAREAHGRRRVTNPI